jgi:hypothetical protein
MRYSQIEPKESFLEILENKETSACFVYGFCQAVAFAHYKKLDKEQKELYCGETMERVLDCISNNLLNELLEEYGLTDTLEK